MTAMAPAPEAGSIPQGDLRPWTRRGPAAVRLDHPGPARLRGDRRHPAVVPTWFEWTGEEIVTATYLAGPAAGIRHPAGRVAAPRANPTVALTIDTETSPPQSVTIRGRTRTAEIDGLAPEYVSAAYRYLGADAAAAMLAGMGQPCTVQARLAVRPTWVGLLDLAARLPSPFGGVREVAS